MYSAFNRSRMGIQQRGPVDFTPEVRIRDFAFEQLPFSLPTKKKSMASQTNIGDVTAKTFSELLSGPLVDIYVGEERRHWKLHKNLLCYHSDWLKDELEPPPLGDGSPKQRKTPEKECEGLRLDLEDQDPRGFELFVKWMYQGKLDDVDTLSEDEEKYEYAVACHKLYALCTKLELPLLRNIAIDQYRKGLHTTALVPDAEEVNQIYRASPARSPFRRLMTQIAARQIMEPDNDKDAENYRQAFEDGADFAIELVNTIKANSGGMLFEDPTAGDECAYHDHADGQMCHVKSKRRTDSPKENDGEQRTSSTSPSPNGRSEPPKLVRQRQPFRQATPPKPPDPPTKSSPPKLAIRSNPAPSMAAHSTPITALDGQQEPRAAARQPKQGIRVQPTADQSDLQRTGTAVSPLTPPPSPPQHPVTPQRSVSFSTPISDTQPARPSNGVKRTASAGILKTGRAGSRPSGAGPGRAQQEQQPASSTTHANPGADPAGREQQPGSVGGRNGRYVTPPTSVTSSSSAERNGKRAPPKLRRSGEMSGAGAG